MDLLSIYHTYSSIISSFQTMHQSQHTDYTSLVNYLIFQTNQCENLIILLVKNLTTSATFRKILKFGIWIQNSYTKTFNICGIHFGSWCHLPRVPDYSLTSSSSLHFLIYLLVWVKRPVTHRIYFIHGFPFEKKK